MLVFYCEMSKLENLPNQRFLNVLGGLDGFYFFSMGLWVCDSTIPEQQKQHK